MIDRQEIWTGGLNEEALGAQPQRRVGLYDTTLRDGEQTVGVVLLPEQKLEIARLLDAFGIDRIEAGFPRVSEEDWRAVEMIRDAGLRAELWGFSRAVPDDVEAIVTLGLQATVIEAPVSEVKLRALGVERSEMLRRIRTAVAHASQRGVRVAYFAVDGSRADLGFLERVYKTALDAGAQELVVVDTIGIATPEAAAYLVGRVREWAGADVPVHFHGHNDFGLATAAAIAAARAGASYIHGTINGMGERAGNTNLAEVALALDALYGAETGLKLEMVSDVSRRVRELSGYQMAPWTPLVGENLFRRETGTAVSQFHVPEAIEPYAASVVGARRGVVLGKRSGRDSIRIKSEELGLTVPAEHSRALLERVKELGMRKRGLVTDDEFRSLVEELD
ncbi:MAG: hypothetical protein M0Z66_04480 [Thermaerobacter sp.]|nr:hypothetical protein [Thermaerobacter sp.]